MTRPAQSLWLHHRYRLSLWGNFSSTNEPCRPTAPPRPWGGWGYDKTNGEAAHLPRRDMSYIWWVAPRKGTKIHPWPCPASYTPKVMRLGLTSSELYINLLASYKGRVVAGKWERTRVRRGRGMPYRGRDCEEGRVKPATLAYGFAATLWWLMRPGRQSFISLSSFEMQNTYITRTLGKKNCYVKWTPWFSLVSSTWSIYRTFSVWLWRRSCMSTEIYWLISGFCRLKLVTKRCGYAHIFSDK